jgi:hypothetical protein
MAVCFQIFPPKLPKFTVGFSAKYHEYTEGNESLALKFILAKRDPSSLSGYILLRRNSTTGGSPGDNRQKSIRNRETLQIQIPFRLKRSGAKTAGGSHPHPQT